jgi:hypothetical protein
MAAGHRQRVSAFRRSGAARGRISRCGVGANYQFLVPLFGRYELYADVQGNEPLIGYCFAQEQNAPAFHAAFAGAAAKPHFKKTG